MAPNVFTCGSSPCGMFSIPRWWGVTHTTTTATLPRPALISAQARRPSDGEKQISHRKPLSQKPVSQINVSFLQSC
jgi:hypothetical protein